MSAVIESSTRVFGWGERGCLDEQEKLPVNDGSVLVTGKMRTFTVEECNEIIQSVQGVYEGDAITSDGGTSFSTESRITKMKTIYPNSEFDWFFDKIEDLVKQVAPQFDIDVTGFYEGAQVYDYPEGGFLDWHMDIGKGIMSDRKLSISIQLSDGDSYDGGNLEFLDTKSQAPRVQGASVVFSSYRMHRVSPVTRGHRKSIVTWVHGRPFR